MITQLDQVDESVHSPIAFNLASPSQNPYKSSIPIFALPETSYINLIEQYSQRYKLNQNKQRRNKAKSSTSYSSTVKQDRELFNQILQLPPSLMIQSSSINKQGQANLGSSYLLTSKKSSKYYKRLPKIPKVISESERMIEEKTVHVLIRQKLIQNQINRKSIRIQSKCCQIKQIIDIKQPQLPKLQNKIQKCQKIVSKSLAQTRAAFQRSNSLNKPNTTKSPLKRQMADYLDTKDSLSKSMIKPINIKYKKGYLIYDSDCYSCFKNRNQIPQRQVILPSNQPEVSARDYCIIDLHTLKPLFMNKLNNHPIEIASLTKIVTCLLTILVCKKYDIDMTQYKCRVSEEASSMIGTSAQLSSGDILTIYELLFGLMLPSGNDAAVALAQNVGRIIQRKKKIQNPPNPINTFVKQMNVLYHELLKQQQKQKHVFKNPSGLIFNPNTTTVEQIAIFAAVACKNQTFYKVVNTKVFDVNIMNQRFGISKKMQWRNTNKLLWKGWDGVKTGTTENAGHCFIGKYQNNIFALLDCETLQKRFTDAEILKKWIWKQ